MYSKTLLNSIHRTDPDALCLVANSRNGYYVAKRILDIVVAFTMLVLLFPLMFIIAVTIFLYSPGPVFFIQKRVGVKRKYYKKRSYWKKDYFYCYKFRTMKINAKNSFHSPGLHQGFDRERRGQDDRIARCPNPTSQISGLSVIRPGKLLRKLSLDELPQLWNILIGDMNSVPQVAIPYEVDMYKPWHLRRLESQPGLTGLQQVTARCTTDFDKQI